MYKFSGPLSSVIRTEILNGVTQLFRNLERCFIRLSQAVEITVNGLGESCAVYGDVSTLDLFLSGLVDKPLFSDTKAGEDFSQ